MVKIVVVDAFTDRPFAGNPAAVCVLDRPAADAWYRAVAREMNLSETAFLVPEGPAYRLRWLTPAVEVDLCGHATLAAAHHLWESGLKPAGEPIEFLTRSGSLTATPGADGWINLDFPAKPVNEGIAPAELAEVLGCEVVNGRFNAFDCLAEVESEETVRSLTPDLGRLASLPVRGTIVTAPATTPGCGYDFVSRFFAPRAGVPEDPVTGSAHCCLAPYWAGRLGKDEMVGYQASARGGIVRVCLDGNRVHLGGQAVTVLRSELAFGPESMT